MSAVAGGIPLVLRVADVAAVAPACRCRRLGLPLCCFRASRCCCCSPQGFLLVLPRALLLGVAALATFLILLGGAVLCRL